MVGLRRRLAAKEQGPKYFLDIESEIKEWDKDTITTEEVIAFGGWDASLEAILIDKDDNERTLQPDEVIEVQPGMGFSKRSGSSGDNGGQPD